MGLLYRRKQLVVNRQVLDFFQVLGISELFARFLGCHRFSPRLAVALQRSPSYRQNRGQCLHAGRSGICIHRMCRMRETNFVGWSGSVSTTLNNSTSVEIFNISQSGSGKPRIGSEAASGPTFPTSPSVSYELPIKIPTANTRPPPTITWSAEETIGISM